MTALEIKGLSKSYRGKRGKKVQALSSLDLSVSPGEVFGFLGPNGAGKSTTIKTLIGQLRPTSGEAFIFGTPVHDTSSRMKVGYLPENPSFYDFMTAREYLRLVGRTFGMSNSAISDESEKVLELLELSDASDRSIRGYSKGMVQRLGLAQTLLHDPDLYLLDEPMSGLDPIGRALVKRIIRDLKERGKTVFFSTHITADVEVVCDRVGVIVKGNLRALDSVRNILQRGVEGYVIQLQSEEASDREIYVVKDELKSFIEKSVASGVAIERIEPQRKDLEAFFLEIVSRSENESQK